MKPILSRRNRRTSKPSKTDGSFFKKENQNEQTFFAEACHETFFQPVTTHSPSPHIQRKCEKCEEEDKQVQRQPEKKEEEEKDKIVQKKENNSAGRANTTSYVSSFSGTGQSLPVSVNNYFSSRMGYDFSKVRIHDDQTAANSARNINAKAYTIGNDIVFNEGQYDASSAEGKKLLAHELTHVMQQNRTQVNRFQLQPENEGEKPDLTGGEAAAENEAIKNEEFIGEPVPVSDVTTFGRPSRDTVFANTVTFTGKTEADFDGGVGQTKNLKGVRAKDCEGCSGDECVTITGTFEITYTVTTTVNLPAVPDGLTPCQQKLVKDAIDNKIAPHEQQHVTAFNTYNGKVQFPINYTGCKDGLQQHLQDINDADGISRKANAKTKSDALDPFFVDVDLDCKEPEPPKK